MGCMEVSVWPHVQYTLLYADVATLEAFLWLHLILWQVRVQPVLSKLSAASPPVHTASRNMSVHQGRQFTKPRAVPKFLQLLCSSKKLDPDFSRGFLASWLLISYLFSTLNYFLQVITDQKDCGSWMQLWWYFGVLLHMGAFFSFFFLLEGAAVKTSLQAHFRFTLVSRWRVPTPWHS